MAMDKQTISGNTWVPISTAGQSGSVMTFPTASYRGKNKVLLAYATSTPASDYEEYLPLLPAKSPRDFTPVYPEASNIIVYARCIGEDGEATIWADFN